MITAIAGALGVKPSVVKHVMIALLILIAIGAFFAVLDRYGDARYNAGVQTERQAWKDAEAAALLKAQQAQGTASVAAAKREAEHQQQVQQEREKISEAVDQGSSPFDVLFPSSVR